MASSREAIKVLDVEITLLRDTIIHLRIEHLAKQKERRKLVKKEKEQDAFKLLVQEDPLHYDPKDGSGRSYFDPGNKLYNMVFRDIWPSALAEYSCEETIGDVLEAVLGVWFIVRHKYELQRGIHLWNGWLHRLVEMIDNCCYIVFVNWPADEMQ